MHIHIVVRYMDQNVAHWIRQKEKGMLGGRTHIKVEETSRDEEHPGEKKPKKEIEQKRKGNTTLKVAEGTRGCLDSEALLAEACRCGFPCGR